MTCDPVLALVAAARTYARALRAQVRASESLAASEAPEVPDADHRRADALHSEACDRLSEAECDLQLAALVSQGWTREEAEEAL